ERGERQDGARDFTRRCCAKARSRRLARRDLLERLGERRASRPWRGWGTRRLSPGGRVRAERLDPPACLERVIAVHKALGEQFIERASFGCRSPLFSQAAQPVKRCRDVRRVGIAPK